MTTRHVPDLGMSRTIAQSFSPEALAQHSDNEVVLDELRVSAARIQEQMQINIAEEERAQRVALRMRELREDTRVLGGPLAASAVALYDLVNTPFTPDQSQDAADTMFEDADEGMRDLAMGAAQRLGGAQAVEMLRGFANYDRDINLQNLVREIEEGDFAAPQGMDSAEDLAQIAALEEALNAEDDTATRALLEEELAIVRTEIQSTEEVALATALTERSERQAASIGTAPQPQYNRTRSMILSAANTLAETPVVALRWADIAQAMVRSVAVLDPSNEQDRRLIQWATDAMEEGINRTFPVDEGRTHEFAMELAAAGGSILGFYLLGAARLPVWAAGAMLQGTAQYEDAVELHASAGGRYMAMILGSGLGLSEAAPIDRAFMRIAEEVGQDLFTRTIANSLASTLEEFIQEAGTAFGEDVIARHLAGYDPEREMNLSDWLHQGGIGALTGAAAGAGTTLIGSSAGRGEQPSVNVDENAAEALAAGFQRLTGLAGVVDTVLNRNAPAGAGADTDGAEGSIAASPITADVGPLPDFTLAQPDAEGQVSAPVQAAIDAAAENAETPYVQLPEDTTANNLRLQLDRADPDTRSGWTPSERVVLTAPEGSGLPDVAVGDITFEDWVTKTESVLTAAEVAQARGWYADIRATFVDAFGVKAGERFMVSWLAANQGVSPSAAVFDTLLQDENLAQGRTGDDAKKARLPEAARKARDILRGEPVTSGVGAKLADFISAGQGSSTRIWTGHDEEGGAPFPVDRHTGRDLGLTDPAYLNALRGRGYTIPPGLAMSFKEKPNVSGGVYDNRADFGRALTEDLNEQGWQGATDWTPAEVQAVGWMSTLKLMDSKAETPQQAIDARSHVMAFEVKPSTSSPLGLISADRFAALPMASQRRLTEAYSNRATKLVYDLVNMPSRLSLYNGRGGWMGDENPAVSTRITATEDQLTAYMSALGAVLEQDEMFSVRVTPLTASAKSLSIQIALPPSMTRAQMGQAFDLLREQGPKDKEGNPLLAGYMPLRMSDGREGINMVAGSTKGHVKAIRAFFETSIDRLVISDFRLRALLRSAEAVIGQAQQLSVSNDWSKGDQDYESNYRNATGSAFPAGIRAGRAAIQADWLKDLAREEQRAATRGERRAATLARSAGSIPFADADGSLTLTHWSAEPRTLLDPAFAGSGPLKGGERSSRLLNVFFGVGIGEKGGYRKENLGPARHEITLPASEIYNLTEDVLGLLRIRPGATSDQAVQEALIFVEQAGYKGWYNPGHPRGAVVGVFEAVTPDTIVDEDTGDVIEGSDFDAQIGDTATSTETPAFKKWFGDSKVVDENGAPLVVYHGTNANAYSTGNFVVFNTRGERGGASFSSSKDQAATYGEETYAVYLNIKNPLVIQADGRGWSSFDGDTRYEGGRKNPRTLSQQNASKELDAILAELELPTDPVELAELDAVTHANTPQPGTLAEMDIYSADVDDLARVARRAGYDGLVVRNVRDGPVSDSNQYVADTYVAFDPTQIKSVFNRGRFDASDPDILAARAPRRTPVPSGIGSSATRQPYRGEPTRPSRGIPATPETEGIEAVSLKDVSDRFVKLMDIVVAQGRFTLKGSSVMGQYIRSQATIRLKSWMDVSTLFHEAGHALHDAMDGPLRGVIQQNKAEVLNAGKTLYGGWADLSTEERKVREGFAELFRLYVQNRAEAERIAPAWTAAMTDMLKRESPDIETGLVAIGSMYDTYVTQPSVSLSRSRITTHKRPTQLDEITETFSELGYKGAGRYYLQQLVGAGVDKIIPLRELTSRIVGHSAWGAGGLINLKTADDPGKLAQLGRNSGNRAMMQLVHGVFTHHGTKGTTRSLQDALYVSQGVGVDGKLGKIDKKRQKDFAAYLVDRRALDEVRRFRQGKIKRMPILDTEGGIRTSIAHFEAQYGNDFIEAADIVNEYAQALWTKQFNAGLLTKEAYENGLDREFYAPLMRDMSDKGGVVGSAMRSLTGRQTPAFKGSDRAVIDPLQSLIQKTLAVEEAIWHNDTVAALAQLADRAGRAGAFVERVPSHNLVNHKVSAAEVARSLTRDENMSDEDASDLLTVMGPHMDRNTMISYFRAEQTSKGSDNLVFFWEAGKLKAIEIKDAELANDVVELFEVMGREAIPLGLEVLSMSSKVFRAGITAWPDFVMVNFIRDQMSAWLATDVGFVPFVSGFKGVYSELKQNEWAQRYNASAGAFGGAGVAQFDQARWDNDVSALRGKGYATKVFQPGVDGFLQGVARYTEIAETGTRLGLFEAAYKRALNNGMSEWEAAMEASFQAVDYMDFGLHGDRTLVVRRAVPFLNAQVQGFYKLYRTLGNSETARRTGLRRAIGAYFKTINGRTDLTDAEKASTRAGQRAWIKMSSMALLSAALTLLFKDDEDYQETSDYLRAYGWVIPLGNGRIMLIPKPFEWALLSNIMERAVEAGYGDEVARERMLRGVVQQLAIPTNNPLLQTRRELKNNYDEFAERDIIPFHMMAAVNADSQLAVNAYTSEMAQIIGSVTGWRPMYVDHFLQNMGASMARDTMFVTDQIFDPNAGSVSIVDAPISRRFFRDASRGSTATSDFWDHMSNRDGTLQGAYRAYHTWLTSGDPIRTNRLFGELSEDEQSFALLNEHFSAAQKRLHPMRRASDISAVVSGMGRDINTMGAIMDTTNGELIQLTARERTLIAQELSDYSTYEARNALVMMGAPGWGHREPRDVSLTLDVIESINPAVRVELEARMRAGRIYSAEAISELWPVARERLLNDGVNAELRSLSDIATNWR